MASPKTSSHNAPENKREPSLQIDPNPFWKSDSVHLAFGILIWSQRQGTDVFLDEPTCPRECHIVPRSTAARRATSKQDFWTCVIASAIVQLVDLRSNGGPETTSLSQRSRRLRQPGPMRMPHWMRMRLHRPLHLSLRGSRHVSYDV